MLKARMQKLKEPISLLIFFLSLNYTSIELARYNNVLKVRKGKFMIRFQNVLCFKILKLISSVLA